MLSFGELGRGEGQIGAGWLPVGVAPNGDIVLGDRNNLRVLAFRPDGAFVRSWASGAISGVAVSAAGDLVFVTDNKHRVQVFRLCPATKPWRRALG